MSLFTKQEDFDIYEKFPDYEETSPCKIKTRTITEEEYKAVPFFYKSKLKTIFSIPGLLLILFSIIAVWSITLCICDVVKGKPDAWLYLFICCMINLFAIAMTLAAYSDKRKQVITKDQKIAPGEVVHIENISRKYYTTIALHGSKEIIHLFFHKELKKGKTVLVVIKPPPELPYVICVPRKVVDYDLSMSQNDITESLVDSSESIDYTAADLESVAYDITPEEYKRIIRWERLLRPFKYGILSAVWLFFTIVTIVLAVIIIKSFLKVEAEVFFPLVMGFLCELFIEWLLCKAVFKKNDSTFEYGILECVIAKKYEDEHIDEKYIRAMIPERKQFVNLKVTTFDYKRLSLNERVKFIVNKSTDEVIRIIRE